MSRSEIMANVGTKDTRPEMIVRRHLHALGYRYALHRRELPGRPDLVFPGRRAVIFVHGCFWHGHGCRWGRLPKTRLDYWAPKIAANVERDGDAAKRLTALGWRTHVVWQCSLLKPPRAGLADTVAFLEGRDSVQFRGEAADGR
jgi:DNA mismatch endonuclease (patch repair protein)